MKENIRLSKKDVLWNYIGTIFNLGTGLITLPLILKFLSPAEIGINYLFLSVSSLVGLIDFGFTPQFSRNITYVFSGASKLKKEGLGEDYQKTTFSFKLPSEASIKATSPFKRVGLVVIQFSSKSLLCFMRVLKIIVIMLNPQNIKVTPLKITR